MISILKGIKSNKLLVIFAIINFSLYSYLSGLTVLNIFTGFFLSLTFILLGIGSIYSLIILEIYTILTSYGLFETLKSYTDFVTTLKIVLPSFALFTFLILLSGYLWLKHSNHYIVIVKSHSNKFLPIGAVFIYLLALVVSYFYYPKIQILMLLKSFSDIITLVGLVLGYILLILRYKMGWIHLIASFISVVFSNIFYNLFYKIPFEPLLFISTFLNILICFLSYLSWNKIKSNQNS